MQTSRTDLDGDLVIIGLSTRTSPARASTEIPAHWQAFMARGQPTDDIFAVYCDYESDFRGPYSLVLGTLATIDAPVPAGQRRVRIPSGRYSAFTVEGDPAQVVWQTWTHINGAWPDLARRRYIADYERYRSGGTIEIGVGIV